MNDKRLPARVLHCHIQGERNRGSIPKKWMENIKDIKDLGLRHAEDTTRDSMKWKHYVTTLSTTSGWQKREKEEEEEKTAGPPPMSTF